jgi:ABC-type phosphate/phosphonate transport system substrate-binding protein
LLTRNHNSTFFAFALCLLILFASAPVFALAKNEITFVGVALDAETKEADEKLREYLETSTSVTFESRNMEYGVAINKLVEWDEPNQGSFMARVTPYVYVAAEMLGADMEILGTYESRSTGNLIYHSYFVVNRQNTPGVANLEDLSKYLQARKEPATFVFHSKFSTSSYFLPSLYFRKKGIISVARGAALRQGFIPIQARKPENISGSSDLVRLVQKGEADFAAVWDGTKAKFADDPNLLFIPLPYEIPNDLLVVSRDLAEPVKVDIVRAINAMDAQAIDVGDFKRWVDFHKSHVARKALASLRWLAKVLPRPVVMQVRLAKHENGGSADIQLLDAARQAIRLAGPEWVSFDKDFHKSYDVLWVLKPSHDDSVILQSSYEDSGIEQEFPISFKKGNLQSLTLRLVTLIRERMHSLRYIWTFDTDTPRVLRDVAFSLKLGDKLKAQRITWVDYSLNDYVVDRSFDVEVTHADFDSFRLQGDGFTKLAGGNSYDFDPMSNVAYRVFLTPGKASAKWIKVFTIAMIGCFALATIFALVAMVRKPESKKV